MDEEKACPQKVLILPKWHDENELCGSLALIVEEQIGITPLRVVEGSSQGGIRFGFAGRLLCGCCLLVVWVLEVRV